MELTADHVSAPPAEERRAFHPDGLSPSQLLVLLRRNWPVIVVCGLLLGGLTFWVTATQLPKMYTAGGTVAVELRSFAIPELQGALTPDASPDPMPLVRSEVQVLSSRALVQSVVEDLHLVDDPEFNPTLRPPALMARASQAIRRALPPSIATALGDAGVLPAPPVTPASPEAVRDAVVAAVQHDLSIVNDNRSLIIDLVFTAQDPNVAAKVVNRLIARYMSGKATARTEADQAANTALQQRIGEVRAQVEQIEQRMQALRQKYAFVQTRAGSVGQQQLEDLSAALTQASSQRAQVEADYQRAAVLARTGGVGGGSGSDVLSSSTIGILRDREAEAERRVAQLASTLGPSHPLRRAAEAELGSARGAVASEASRVMAALSAQAQAARARETDLRNQLSGAEKSAAGLASVQSELQQLEKDADAQRSLYQTLLQRAEQTEASKSGAGQAGARVVSLAVTPDMPTSPRPKLAGAIGMIGGFAFGGLLAAVVRRRARGYADAEEIAADTGLATMAVLPRAGGRGVSLPGRVIADPAGPEAEALRSLRTRLRFAGRGAMPRSVLFVASLPGEGSSSIAAAFARVAALDGLRVLLAEGDLLTPALAQLLEIAPSNGMVDTLEGREQWQEATVRDRASGLDALLAQAPQVPSNQLLETMQLQNMLADAREEYNLIVLDGPPLAQATASITLANLADAVVLVVEAGETGREQVRGAVKAVAAATNRPPVIALNKAA